MKRWLWSLPFLLCGLLYADSRILVPMITVMEADGSPKGRVNTLSVSNGSLTLIGTTASITTGGGGGGGGSGSGSVALFRNNNQNTGVVASTLTVLDGNGLSLDVNTASGTLSIPTTAQMTLRKVTVTTMSVLGTITSTTGFVGVGDNLKFNGRKHLWDNGFTVAQPIMVTAVSGLDPFLGNPTQASNPISFNNNALVQSSGVFVFGNPLTNDPGLIKTDLLQVGNTDYALQFSLVEITTSNGFTGSLFSASSGSAKLFEITGSSISSGLPFFIGPKSASVLATNSAGQIIAGTPSVGSSTFTGVGFQDEGTFLGEVSSMNCVGANMVCSQVGALGTIKVTDNGWTNSASTVSSRLINLELGISTTNAALGSTAAVVSQLIASVQVSSSNLATAISTTGAEVRGNLTLSNSQFGNIRSSNTNVSKDTLNLGSTTVLGTITSTSTAIFNGDLQSWTTDFFVESIAQVSFSSICYTTPSLYNFSDIVWQQTDSTGTWLVQKFFFPNGVDSTIDPILPYAIMESTGVHPDQIYLNIAVATPSVNGTDQASMVWNSTTSIILSSATAGLATRMKTAGVTALTSWGARAADSKLVYVKIWLWNLNGSGQRFLHSAPVLWRRRT